MIASDWGRGRLQAIMYDATSPTWTNDDTPQIGYDSGVYVPTLLEEPFLLSLARFSRTRERPCMNRVRSLLSMRGMLLGYSLRLVQQAQLGLSVHQYMDVRTQRTSLTTENKMD